MKYLYTLTTTNMGKLLKFEVISVIFNVVRSVLLAIYTFIISTILP